MKHIFRNSGQTDPTKQRTFYMVLGSRCSKQTYGPPVFGHSTVHCEAVHKAYKRISKRIPQYRFIKLVRKTKPNQQQKTPNHTENIFRRQCESFPHWKKKKKGQLIFFSQKQNKSTLYSQRITPSHKAYPKKALFLMDLVPVHL